MLGSITKRLGDSKTGCDWPIDVHNLISKARYPGESHLLMLDGHALHTDGWFRFLRYCGQNDIVVFYLAPYYSHHLCPLDVKLFPQL